MITFALVTLMLTTTMVDGAETQSVVWNPVPLSVHATFKDCENAYNDISGFPRRPNDIGWPQYNPMLGCKRVNQK